MCDTRSITERSAYTLIELLLVLSIIAAVAGISWPLLMRPMAQSVVQGAAQELAEHLAETRIRAIEESRVYEFRWKPGSGEFEIKAQHEHRHQGSSQAATSRASNQILEGRPVKIGDGDSQGVFTEVSQGSVDGVASQASDATHIHERLSASVRFESDELVTQLRELAGLDESGQPALDGAERETSSVDGSSRLDGEEYQFSRETALRQLDRLQQERNQQQAPSNPNSDDEEAQLTGWSQAVKFYPDGTCSNGRWALLAEDLNRVEVELRGMSGTVRVGKVSPLKLELEIDPSLENFDGSSSRGDFGGQGSFSSGGSRTPNSSLPNTNPSATGRTGFSPPTRAPLSSPTYPINNRTP